MVRSPSLQVPSSTTVVTPSLSPRPSSVVTRTPSIISTVSSVSTIDYYLLFLVTFSNANSSCICISLCIFSVPSSYSRSPSLQLPSSMTSTVKPSAYTTSHISSCLSLSHSTDLCPRSITLPPPSPPYYYCLFSTDLLTLTSFFCSRSPMISPERTFMNFLRPIFSIR